MEKEKKTQQDEENVGKPQTIINIKCAYDVTSGVKEVHNTFFTAIDKDGIAAFKKNAGMRFESAFKRSQVQDGQDDDALIRAEIVEYVNRVRTLLTDEAKSTFKKMWGDILDLPEVKSKVYKTGKQWGTNFNRDLVANILYHLRNRKIYKVVYRNNINSARIAECLERNKEHAVKHALRSDPPMDVCKAIDKMLNEKY